jgi:hypothetical protein
MDRNHPMLPGTTTYAPGETLPLLYNTSEEAPYQAYCETVIDPASPSHSPGLSLSESILRPRTPSLQFTFTLRQQEPHEVNQNTSLFLSAASSPEHPADDVPLLKTGKESKRQTTSPNCRQWSSDTTPGSPNHITPTVTPRGSHLLAPIKMTAYDRTPSHLRMQQMEPHKIATVRKILRKPIEGEPSYADANYHPLPFLPLRPFAVHDGYARLDEVQDGSIQDVSFGLHAQNGISKGERLKYSNEDESPSPPKHSEYPAKRRPLPDLPHGYSEPSLSRRNIDASSCPILSPPRHPPHICELSRSPRKNPFHDPTQLPSLAELYGPRGLLAKPQDDRRARLRTESKATTLRYQFGARLPRGTHVPPSKGSRVDRFHEQTEAFLYASPTQEYTPTPSIHSIEYFRTGPRRPPWGSYEDLEMQRLQRGDRRDGEHARRNRMALDSRSTLQQDHSTESLGLKSSIVVGDQDTQIQRKYSNMDVDDQAARGDAWCCCNVM